MRDLGRAVTRLLILQCSWTYERMQGVGIGFASLPLLRPLTGDPERYRAAVARSVEYFNAHPYLAGIAVGAATRAERDGVPGPSIQRLKTALAGPLGSLGDQLFWIGIVPFVMAAVLVAVVFGTGWLAVATGLAVYLAVRLALTVWAVRIGDRAGMTVSTALRESGLPEQVRRVGLLAGFAVGAAIPLVLDWLVVPGPAGWVAAAGGVGGGVVAGLVRFRVTNARMLTMVGMLVVLLWHWSRP